MDTSEKPNAKAPKEKPWADMTGVEKLVFSAKVCVMLCSFGFIYGNILTD